MKTAPANALHFRATFYGVTEDIGMHNWSVILATVRSNGFASIILIEKMIHEEFMVYDIQNMRVLNGRYR